MLARRGEMLDIDPADLESVVNEAQLQAYARTFDELTCADIMSHPVASVFATTTATTAADILSRRAVKALPVADPAAARRRHRDARRPRAIRADQAARQAAERAGDAGSRAMTSRRGSSAR